MMKICYVYCQELKSDDLAFSGQPPCRLARIMGDSARVYALFSGDAECHRFRELGVMPISINSRFMNKGYLFRFMALIYYTYRIGRMYNIDVFLNVWSHYLVLAVWMGAKLCGSQVLASIGGIPIKREYIHKKRSMKNRIRKNLGLLLEWWSLRVAKRIHAVSHSLKSEFITRGVRADKIHVISRGIDTDIFRMVPGLRKNRPDGGFHVGTVSRIDRLKNIETIIEGFALISEKYPSMYLHIGGGGKHKRELINIVFKKHLTERVVFHGYLNMERLIPFYNNIDLFVLASTSEGIANVVLEALACGLPVVATGVGDIPKHLAQGRGFLFDVGDHKELARVIEQIYSMEGECENIKVKRREYVLKNHSFFLLKGDYLNLFRQVLEDR